MGSMKVLVTGGAGFIGSNVAAALVAAGHRVTVLDSLESGRRDALPAGVAFREGDLASRGLLDEVFAAGEIEAVLHFAAYIEVGLSMEEPARFLRNNTANTISLAEAAVRHGVRKFVFSSTAAVYGEPRYSPLDEAHPTAPTSPYGLSKLLAEQALGSIAQPSGMACVFLRYFNVSGAGAAGGEDRPRETHLLPLLLESSLGLRGPVQIFGTDYPTPDGTCIRDYLHVLDLARAHVLALEADTRTPVDIFNLGTGRGFSNREVLAAVAEVTGRPANVVMVQRRPGDPAALVASADKARLALGWVPEHSRLETILKSTWDWRRSRLSAGAPQWTG